MRLDPWLRRATYLVVAVLFLSGTGWFVGSQFTEFSRNAAWRQISPDLLMLHGGAAMVFLLLLGALGAHHIPIAWRVGKNRPMGLVMLGSNVLLIGTAFGLYYFGSDALRRWTSDLHIAIGLGWPALLALHIVLGRLSVAPMRRRSLPKRQG